MKLELEKLSQKYDKWLSASQAASSKLADDNPKKRKKHLKEVAEARVELYKLLNQAVAIKLQSKLWGYLIPGVKTRSVDFF